MMNNFRKVMVAVIALNLIALLYMGYVQAEQDIAVRQAEKEASLYIETNYMFQPFLKATKQGDEYCGMYQGKKLCDDESFNYNEKELILSNR